MDGEVVDALLALLDQRVAEDLPGQVLGDAADLLQRLVDRHRADRHRRVADDPLADVVDVAAGREVHHRVGAPADRPDHLVDLLGDRRGDRRIADVGVDLHQEVAADDHRLDLRMVDVGRDDGAAAGDLVAHELRGDHIGDRGAEAARRRAGPPRRLREADVLANGDVLHLRRDDAGAGVGELGDRLAGLGAQRPVADGERRHQLVVTDEAVVGRLDDAGVIGLDVAAAFDPRGAQRRNAAFDVDCRVGVGIGTGGVVDGEGAAVAEIDLAHRHAHRASGDVDLARSRQRAGGDGDAGKRRVHRRSSFQRLQKAIRAGLRHDEGGDGGIPFPSPA